jgi:dethiobiotin synthetase
MKGLFITGTDTGAGKTYVTAGLARQLRFQGRPVNVCKPVATGAAASEGRRWSEDTLRLAEAAGVGPDLVTAWTFAEPAAPPVAAGLEGVALSLPLIAAFVRRKLAPNVLTLVEGVGGLLCPLTKSETVADLAALLGLPLLVVAPRTLGTLNHTLLTLEVARHRGLPVVGLVLTATAPVRCLAEETCVEELRRRIAVPLLAVLPYGADPGPLAEIDWWALAEARRI